MVFIKVFNGDLNTPTVDFRVEINKVEANTHFRVWPSLSTLHSVTVSINILYMYLICLFTLHISISASWKQKANILS